MRGWYAQKKRTEKDRVGLTLCTKLIFMHKVQKTRKPMNAARHRLNPRTAV
jgi:hypothetical protein